MQTDICREACLLIQQLMESYVSGDKEQMERVMEFVSPDILVIGTGKHEFYQNIEALAAGMEQDQEEARGVEFVIVNEWYKAKLVSDDACIVYGEFEARESDSGDKQMIISMDTRITSTVHQEPDGRLIIDSLHQSVPYIYQQEGEYYPKTFANQAEEAIKRSEILEKDIQLDAMTGLFNRKYTEKHINRLLKEKGTGGLLLLLDLDEFKKVNDMKGHQAGDALIKEIAAILKNNSKEPDIAGRVGGDEFMLFMPGAGDKREGEAKAVILIKETREVLKDMGFEQSCSIGIVCADGGTENFEDLYRRADEALYKAKSEGKGMHCWYGRCKELR